MAHPRLSLAHPNKNFHVSPEELFNCKKLQEMDEKSSLWEIMPDLSETSGMKRLCTAYDCPDCPSNPEDVTDIEDSDYDFSDDDIPAGMGFYF